MSNNLVQWAEAHRTSLLGPVFKPDQTWPAQEREKQDEEQDLPVAPLRLILVITNAHAGKGTKAIVSSIPLLVAKPYLATLSPPNHIHTSGFAPSYTLHCQSRPTRE